MVSALLKAIPRTRNARGILNNRPKPPGSEVRGFYFSWHFYFDILRFSIAGKLYHHSSFSFALSDELYHFIRTVNSFAINFSDHIVLFQTSFVSIAIVVHADDFYTFAIIGVLYQDTIEDARRFVARNGDGGWPNLVDGSSTAAINFGVSGVPESFLIDAEGIVRFTQRGAITEQVIAAQLVPLLSDAASGSSP